MIALTTIGHSTRTFEEFVDILRAAGVASLVDVRRFPGSRRHPQFERERLAAGLGEALIGYRHEPRLGGRREPHPDSPNGLWRHPGFRGYADHMASQEFRCALADLRAEAGARATAVMCAEAVPWRCHRQLIADAFVALGGEVTHLLGSGSERRHSLHPGARPGPGGELTYPASAQLKLPGAAGRGEPAVGY